jgi:ATP-dependent helicase/nuclease subunit A
MVQINDIEQMAGDAQRQAADPDACVWVGASAGTGKTKVLTDRLLTLLLEGVAPERLLCLTFTRAAAGEMSNRIATRLLEWTTLPEAKLKLALTNLTGHLPNEDMVTRAKCLFAHVIESPAGLKIQTIHSFCQLLLRRFPLEAGVSPQFQVADEPLKTQLVAQAMRTVFMSENESDIDAFIQLIAVFNEDAMRENMQTCLQYKDTLPSIPQARTILEQKFHIDLNQSIEELTQAFCQNDFSELKNATDFLLQGSVTDQQKGQALAHWLEKNDEERESAFEDICDVFLTKEGEVRKTLVTQKVLNQQPALKELLQKWADRLFELKCTQNRLQAATLSLALLAVGKLFISTYEKIKKQRSLLDYHDLISYTKKLLGDQSAASWVLYKLDGGIDHILVDEAQDTSAEQWEIISAIAEEFFAGDGARDNKRSIFVVGDRKQSIYSFQGADPAIFTKMKKHFGTLAIQGKMNWKDIDLQVSFRSTPAILQTVDHLLTDERLKKNVVHEDINTTHQPYRIGQGGLVELWPVCQSEKDSDESQDQEGNHPRFELIETMVATIRKWLDEKVILPSKGRPIMPRDILILVQKRGGFVYQLVGALKETHIPVAGVDRLTLIDHIGIKDLLALAKFVTLPKDDLNLAVILKSPFVGFNEEQLFDLCYKRSTSLWEQLVKKGNDSVPIRNAYQFLDELHTMASCSPFVFYSHILDQLDGRKKLLARLGEEVLDPLSEFMSIAYQFSQHNTGTLMDFVEWLEESEIEVKREFDPDQQNAVRIMTVHGSKGLQSPIVFMPDTTDKPTSREKIAWLHDDNKRLPLWAGGLSKSADPALTALDDAKREQMYAEYLRLLYVAMTRAEDRLYICGWHTGKNIPKGCWHDIINENLATLGQPLEMSLGMGRQVTSPQETDILSQDHQQSDGDEQNDAAPSWIWEKVTVAPAEVPVKSPSRQQEDGVKHDATRGTILHKLLEVLPEVPPANRRDKAQSILAKYSREDGTQLIDIAIHIIENPDFGHIFGTNSQAEVPIAETVDGKVMLGKVDRIVVGDREILIIDYKTERRPATDVTQIPLTHLKQMLAYKHVLQRIYPTYHVQCAFLWTETMNLMYLPDSLLLNSYSI